MLTTDLTIRLDAVLRAAAFGSLVLLTAYGFLS